MPSDTFSAYQPSLTSSGFTSIDSTHYPHIIHSGRRFQNFIADRYPIPNDDSEIFREEFLHKCLERCFDRVSLAELPEAPQKILDLGTGGGFWAIAMGDLYPSAQVIGIDLSCMQPHLHPPNVEWRIDDLEAEWPPTYHHANLIHARAVLGCIRDVPALLSKAYSSLIPGGIIELSDPIYTIFSDDNTLPPSYAPNTLLSAITHSFTTTYGWPTTTTIPSALPAFLYAAGFRRIRILRTRLPIGDWPLASRLRELGVYMHYVIEAFFPAVLARPLDIGMGGAEVERLVGECRGQLADPEVHGWMWWWSVTARRPAEGEEGGFGTLEEEVEWVEERGWGNGNNNNGGSEGESVSVGSAETVKW